MTCTRCAGTGWVCEDHPDKPMEHDSCGGAGAPCPMCNTMATEYRKEIADAPNVIDLLNRPVRWHK